MDAARFVEHLRTGSLAGEIEHVQEMAEREAAHGELAHALDPRLETALDERGLLPLYTHQARAVDAALSGCDVALATPTASGKSLCYHVPVAQAMLTDTNARALYLFPTKALTQDQLRGLKGLLPPKLAARVAIFDGDTPTGERSAVRRSAQAVFTNPDMLHVGMLPHHRTWARLWQSLRYVVIDEMHVYRGVFGSHVANVCGGSAGCARTTAATRSSSSVRPRSPTPANWRSVSPASRWRRSWRTARPTARSTSSSGTRRWTRRGYASARAARRRRCWRCS